MMKKNLVALILVLTSALSYGTILEKKYHKVFKSERIKHLLIENRYGNVEIRQTNGREIEIFANIVVTAKKHDRAQALLDIVNIKDSLDGNRLVVRSEFAKNVLLRKKIWSNDLIVSYVVKVPKNIVLTIINSRGDVLLDSFVGDMNVLLKDGNFRATSVSGGLLYVDQAGGYFNAGDLETVSLHLKRVTMVGGYIDEGEIAFTDSNISVQEMLRLKFNTYGGMLKVARLANVTGESDQTKVEIGELTSSLNLKTRYGRVNILKIDGSFTSLSMDSKHSDISLNFEAPASYSIEMTHNEALMVDIPEGMVFSPLETENPRLKSGKARVGNGRSKVNLDLRGGMLSIKENFTI